MTHYNKHNKHNKHNKYNKNIQNNAKKIRGEIFDPALEISEYNIKPVLKFNTANECKQFIQNFESVAARLIDYTIITNYEKLKQVILDGIEDSEDNSEDNSDNKDNKNNDSDNIDYNLPKEYESILNIVNKKKNFYNNGVSLKERVINTLHYLFYHMRSGIYCRIANNKIKQFIIFVNEDYENNWSKYLTFADDDGNIVSIDTYYQIKRNYYRRENIIEPSKWWCNGHMFDNEPSPNLFGMHLVSSITDMLYYLSQSNKLKNRSFFINKRDYPQLRVDGTEPYDFLFPTKTKLSEKYIKTGFVPIHSYFSSEVFADILIPSTDDWDTLTGLITLADRPSDRYSEINYNKYKNIKWADKKNTAFFRGSGTGGPDIASNQRFQLAKLSNEYNNLKDLDAGVVTWNVRDKKISSDKPVTFVRYKKIGFELAKFVPMSEQMKMKYIIYVDGHCAAARYMYIMKMKVVILKVESLRPETGELWFFPLLENMVDHISIKADMSDLIEKIHWCQQNDDECKKIAKTAYRKCKTLLTKENVLNYYAYVINHIQ